MALYNLAGFKTATLGVADVVFSAPITALNTFPLAGVPNGATVTYMLENFDGGGNVDAREVGRGTWNSGTLTLARTTVVDSTNGGAKIVLGGNAEARITAIAQDFSAAAVGAPALVTPSVAGNFVSFSNTTGGQADSGVSAASFQPIDATLTSIAALGTAANKMIYTTGVDTWAEADLTAFARTFLDDANAAAVLTTLGAQAALTFPLASTLGGTGINNAGTLTNASNTTITGGGTVALGGFTLTVPATGTAALLATANVFTTQQMVDGTSDQIQLRVQAHSTQTTAMQTWENSSSTALTSIKGNGGLLSSITISNFTNNLIHHDFTSNLTLSGNSSNNFFHLKNLLTTGTNGFNYSGTLTSQYNQMTHPRNGTVGAADALLNEIANQSSGTIGASRAIHNHVQNNSTGVITNAYGDYTRIRNTGAGSITNAYYFYGVTPTISAGSIDSVYGLYLENMSGGTLNYAVYTNIGSISILGSDTKASAAGATWNGIELRAATATITGSTNITTATGFNYHSIAQPTLSAASALTVTNAATLYIANAPAAAGAGPATITNAYALWVDDGISRFDDQLFVDGSADRVQLRVQAHSTQTANLQTWENSSGTPLVFIAGTGAMRVGDLTTAITSGGFNALLFAAVLSPSGASSATVTGVNGSTEISTAQNITGGGFGATLTALTSSISAGKTVANISAIRLRSYSSSTATGALTTAKGIDIDILGFPSTTSQTLITNLIGIDIGAPTTTQAGGGAVTNAYGIKIGNVAGAVTLNYSIFTGTGLVHFGDNVDITGSLRVDSVVNDTGLAAGTYTPTRSAEANLDANVTMTEAQYMRVGNTVTVSGRFTADPTLPATTTSFEITLPVASNIGAVEDLAGTAFCGNIAAQGAEVVGSVANNTAVVQWKSSDTTSQTWSYIFTYQVI